MPVLPSNFVTNQVISTVDGNQLIAERKGHVYPIDETTREYDATASYDLGGASNQWRNVYTDKIIAYQQPACRVYVSAGQNLTSTSWETILFDAESFDRGGFHSTSANTSRLTAPQSGLYWINSIITLGENDGSEYYYGVRIWLNATTALVTNSPPQTTSIAHSLGVSTLQYLTAGQYIEVQVDHRAFGANRPVTTGTDKSFFEIVMVGG